MTDIRPPVVTFNTLHAGFICSAARWADRPALLQGSKRWNYATVDAAARRLAAGLLTLSDAPRRVGVLARRSFTSYTGVLGALFCGAAFVPLNPTLPIARLQAVAEAAELDAIITEGGYIALLNALRDGHLSRVPVLVTDVPRHDLPIGDGARLLGSDDLDAIAPLQNPVNVATDDHAYILFTSGSTGRPKGVPISHANAAAFLNINLSRYQIEPNDVLSQTFEQSFDLSVFDIFMAWSAGASFYSFTSTELLSPLSVVQTKGITIWFSVPSAVAMQIRLGSLLPGSLPSLRLSLFCGEPLVRAHAEAWQAAASASVVENLYGPTELTIACAVYRWNRNISPDMCANGLVPIGRLYESLSWQIVGPDFRAVARGEVGELCVAGPQTFAGYWKNPDATAAAFYESTDARGEPLRFYRTGDLVQEHPDGDLLFVGRRDHQIKLAGHRIELAEIEAALRAQPNVVEAAALAWPPNGAVVEMIIAAASGDGLDGETLRRNLRSVLPAYMVPARIDIIESMPRTNSGKLDKRGVSELLATPLEERIDAR